MRKISAYMPLVLALTTTVAGCAAQESPSFRSSIEPVCIEATPEDPELWICPDVLEVACGDVPEFVHVVVEENVCDGLSLVSIDGPFAPGEHDIVVRDENSDGIICETQLIVTDTEAPEVVTRDLEMWPPNHKMHAFELLDCFEEVIECDPEWEARVLFISSDEGENENGDGNSAPDIVMHDATHFELRSERQGGSNGRVYTVGWEVRDSSGNVTEGACRVDVPHDRSGKPAVDDGEAYRIDAE